MAKKIENADEALLWALFYSITLHSVAGNMRQVPSAVTNHAAAIADRSLDQVKQRGYDKALKLNSQG